MKDGVDTILHSADAAVNLNPLNDDGVLGSVVTKDGLVDASPLGIRLVKDAKEVSGDNHVVILSLIPIANG